MPCTYCGSLRHTRSKCGLIEEDFKTYQNLSVLLRKKFINELLGAGMGRGAVVQTYNRDGGAIGFSQRKIIALGDLDILSCYEKIGRSLMSVVLSSRLVIEVEDDDERLVSQKHCYKVIEESKEGWSQEWVDTHLLDFDGFKARIKSKKRHPAFTRELYSCMAKELTEKKKTTAEIIEEMEKEMENENTTTVGVVDNGSVYVVTSTSTSDDYKRVYSNTETQTALTFDDAKAIAAHMFLERVQDYDMFDYNEETLTAFKEEVANTDATEIADKVYDFFTANDDLFQGEFVPCTFTVDIEDKTATKVATTSLMGIVNELTEEC